MLLQVLSNRKQGEGPKGISYCCCDSDSTTEPEGGQHPRNVEGGATATPTEKAEQEYLHTVSDWKYLISGPMLTALSIYTESLNASAQLLLLLALFAHCN